MKNDLTDPDARPGCDVVVWDGQCNFCRSQVERLRALDWYNRLTFLSLHDPRVSLRYGELSLDQLMSQMWVVTPSGTRFGGADAIRYLSRAMPSLWILAPIMHLPLCMPLWRAVYRWIARRRYLISGKKCDNGSCDLHR